MRGREEEFNELMVANLNSEDASQLPSLLVKNVSHTSNTSFISEKHIDILVERKTVKIEREELQAINLKDRNYAAQKMKNLLKRTKD
jgi:Fe-S cluster biosynthesis and repair protein YggX